MFSLCLCFCVSAMVVLLCDGFIHLVAVMLFVA